MNKKTFGFIGLGLIGGSIARRFRLKLPDCRILACSGRPSSLEGALNSGVIDEICPSPDPYFSSCDVIFLCAPVSVNLSYLETLKKIIRPGCLITDVGSTKAKIHQEIARLSMEDCFIGGHPMAGSEKTGFENSKDYLIENAWYVLTPTAETSQSQLAFMKELVSLLGGLPLVLDYQRHDEVVAAISHLPHIIASSLVNLIKDSDDREGTMRQVAAGGFKDITRIASASPDMWQQVCLQNGGAIARILSSYIDSLQNTLQDLKQGDEDALYRLFDDSRAFRNSIPDSSLGPIKKEYSIYCDIKDEAGAIATIATILAAHQISIKNIGILHNREFEEGVLQVEFYEESAQAKAGALLEKHRYTLFKR